MNAHPSKGNNETGLMKFMELAVRCKGPKGLALGKNFAVPLRRL
jgi:hypothetical protein